MAGPKRESGQGTGSAEADAGSSSEFVSAGDPFGFSDWMKDAQKVAPLHPLMQHPVAAIAAATAIGFGVTSHLAGVMFGAMQGMVDAAQKAQEAEPVANAAQPVAPAPERVAEKAPVSTEPASVEKVAKPRRAKPAARIVETVADDLKKIAGIGPKLEQVLNGMGIRRYQDIARWTDKDIARIDRELGFGGRIARDGWVESAKALMKG